MTTCVVQVLAAAVVSFTAAISAPAQQSHIDHASPPAPGAKAGSDPATDLVTVQHGEIPIILVAGHGGGVRVKGSHDRTSGVTVRDVNTAELALLASQRITEVMGRKPFVVIAQFSRKDADVNRAAEEAYENDAAKQQYEAFHRAVRSCVDECRERFEHAILLDVHGQVRDPGAIVRGTRNGASVTRLVKRAGNEAIIGHDSVFGRLKEAGYRVEPDCAHASEGPAEPPICIERFFDGGFIVSRYGSQNDDGIDAVQVEFGEARTQSLLKVSKDFGDAVSAFARRYLIPAPGSTIGKPGDGAKTDAGAGPR